MSNSVDFYRSEVVLWRGVAAIGISTMLVPVVSFILTALLHFSVFAPYSWLSGVFWMLVSIRHWFYVSIMSTAFVLLATSKLRYFTVVADYGTNRLGKILSLCHVNKLLHVIGQGTVFAVMTSCLLAVLGGRYGNFTAVNEEDGTRYLNEQHVFLLLHGAFTGVVSAVCFFTRHHYVIVYPLIQQRKWNAARDHVMPALKSSAMFVLYKIGYFYLLYYLFLGGTIKSWLGRYVAISDMERVDSLWGLCDVHLFVWACMTGSVLIFFVNMFCFIYTLYQTEPFEMTIQASLEGNEQCKLTDSLSADAFPLFQFQGYQDLYLLSKHSPERRALLFSLSPLGGHPHNWTEVSQKCLSSLNTFTEQVKQFNAASLGNGSAHFTSSSVVSNGTSSSGTKQTQEPSLKQQMYNNLQQRQALSYFLSTPPDVALQQVLAHAQKYVWNIQALANLVVASYTEDKYGVVQKSLRDVITAIATLRDEIDKLCKLTGTAGRGDADPHSALRACLKAALYNIINTFSSHLDAIHLAPDVSKKLHLFAEYKV